MNFESEKETLRKIIRNKRKLEDRLKLKLELKGNEISIKGKEIDIYIAEKVFSALEKNFPISIALLLCEENYILKEIPIKDLSKKKNIKIIRARIIGTKGKALKTISGLSDCHLTLHNNIVSIIGPADKIKETINAITDLIHGSKHSNIYRYLERQRKKIIPEDLGLK